MGKYINNNTDKPNIAVISTVHETYDTRIFYKQISSLQSNYDVMYFSPIKKKSMNDGIIPLYKSKTKVGRLFTHISLIIKLISYKSNIYILHDPELIPLGIILKYLGKKVVFDMHEDTYSDLITKSYIPDKLKYIISNIYIRFQNIAIKLFDGIILSDDEYMHYFNSLNNVCIVHNYPIINNLLNCESTIKEETSIVYIGSITKNRGIHQLLDVVSQLKKRLPNIKLILIGPFDQKGLEPTIRMHIAEMGIEDNVVIYGPRRSVDAYPSIARCMIGLALLLPEPNFTKSLPTKMFEYMALGLPVVVSNFPLWKRIVDKHHVGIAVDPFDIASISDTICKMLLDKEFYESFARNARESAQDYSWKTEEVILLGFLEKIIIKA